MGSVASQNCCSKSEQPSVEQIVAPPKDESLTAESIFVLFIESRLLLMLTRVWCCPGSMGFERRP